MLKIGSLKTVLAVGALAIFGLRSAQADIRPEHVERKVVRFDTDTGFSGLAATSWETAYGRFMKSIAGNLIGVRSLRTSAVNFQSSGSTYTKITGEFDYKAPKAEFLSLYDVKELRGGVVLYPASGLCGSRFVEPDVDRLFLKNILEDLMAGGLLENFDAPVYQFTECTMEDGTKDTLEYYLITYSQLIYSEKVAPTPDAK